MFATSLASEGRSKHAVHGRPCGNVVEETNSLIFGKEYSESLDGLPSPLPIEPSLPEDIAMSKVFPSTEVECLRHPSWLSEERSKDAVDGRLCDNVVEESISLISVKEVFRLAL